MKKYSNELIEAVKNMYLTTSKTNKEIGDYFNIPKSTIQDWTIRYNWQRPDYLKIEFLNNKSQKFTKIKLDADYYKAKYLYESTSLSIPAISEKVNLTAQMIRDRIKRDNWIRPDYLNHEMHSNTAKNCYKNYSKEKLLEIKEKMSKTNKLIWQNRPEADKERIKLHSKQTWRKKSKQEIKDIYKRVSENNKITYQNKTEEEKLAWRQKLSVIQKNLPPEIQLRKLQRDIDTKRKNNSFGFKKAFDGTTFKSSYEKTVYEFCIRNNIPVETQIPIEFEYENKKRITLIDFKIDGLLFECKGTHLLQGVYDYALPVPIEQKLKIYKENHVILITSRDSKKLLPKKESKESNGLKYLNKCSNPLISVDIDLFKDPAFPFTLDKPKCFYKVKVNKQKSPYEVWSNEKLRWKLIKNRINYVGGFIDSKEILYAMNVTKTCKQPSWFSKKYAKDLIKKYITTNYILDSFAGWGTRCEASMELGICYYGCDLNNELVEWHNKLGRNIIYEDANNFKYTGEDCSVFICPPYTDTEIYFNDQDTTTTQIEWLKIVINNIPNAQEYLMVFKDIDDPKYRQFIVEEKLNKSHLGSNKEYVILVKQKDKKEFLSI